MPPLLITLTTDFGPGSHYVAAMKGVILSLNPHANIIDLSHNHPPQDIATGALFWLQATQFFPPNAIHVAVIDPGVGSSRRILLFESPRGLFLAPDNGLGGWLADTHQPLKIRQVENRALWRPEVSATFHGRDIFAPVAAHLSLGRDPVEVGPIVQSCVRLPANKGERVGQRIEGEVIEIDSFGNLITNISREMLADVPTGESCRITCDEHETFGIFTTYSDQPPMTLIALVGSDDRLELAIVDDSAALMLGVKKGVKVVIVW